MMNKIFKHLDGVIKGQNFDMFQFGDLGLNVDDLETIPQHDFPQLNQGAYSQTKMACTIVGSLIDACYLYGIKPTQADMLKCVIFAHEADTGMAQYQYGKGRWADLGMRVVEKRFEETYPSKKLFYSTVRRDEPNFWKLLKKGYMLGFTYDGNYEYNKDYQSDCVLNGNKFGNKTYGHRTSLFYRDNKLWVLDSYAGHTYNVYEVKDFNGLIQNCVYDEVFFVFTKEANILDTKETARLVQMRNTANVINYNANKQIVLTTDELYKNDLREIIYKNIDKVAQIDQMIKKGENGLM